MSHFPLKPFHQRCAKPASRRASVGVLISRVVGVFLVLLILGYVADLIR